MSNVQLPTPEAQYTLLLFQLHGLIATGFGDSYEADQVRDQMDSEWARLTAEKRDLHRQVSESLYAFQTQTNPTES